METKLWIALCALLVNSGSVYCEENSGAKSPTGTPKTVLNPNTTDHEQKNSNNTNSFSSNSAQGNETTAVQPKPTNDDGTGSSSGLVPDTIKTSTPAPVSNNFSISINTSHSTTNFTTKATFISPTSKSQTTPSSSNHTILNHVNSTAPSNQSTQTPTTIPMNISTVATAPSTLTPSNSSSPKSPSTHPPANTSQSSGPPEVSTASPPNSTLSTQTKILTESSSHLTVGGNTAVAPDSPTFDPLLAGLVSAFVITAIIITLLLFLKLRRRQSGPAFRRLQEVPMDDMEETPLYSY